MMLPLACPSHKSWSSFEFVPKMQFCLSVSRITDSAGVQLTASGFADLEFSFSYLLGKD
jgi:hypothetical protein